MLKSLKERFGAELEKYDISNMYALASEDKGGMLAGINIPKTGLNALLALSAPAKPKGIATLNIVQEEDGRIVGGNTFVLRALKT